MLWWALWGILWNTLYGLPAAKVNLHPSYFAVRSVLLSWHRCSCDMGSEITPSSRKGQVWDEKELQLKSFQVTLIPQPVPLQVIACSSGLRGIAVLLPEVTTVDEKAVTALMNLANQAPDARCLSAFLQGTPSSPVIYPQKERTFGGHQNLFYYK